MALNTDTLKFVRDKRFETYAGTEDGDDIEQVAFDAVFDDLYTELDAIGEVVYASARRYKTLAAFLASGADYSVFAADDIIMVGDQAYKVVATGAVTYHQITVSGAEGAGGLKVVEAGAKFTSTTTAGQGDTLGAVVVLAGGVPFIYDAGGTDLTTGDGRTWSRIGDWTVHATYGGTANAITLTTGQSMAAIATGQEFVFLATAANTGSTTINVDGIGVVTCKTPGGANLPSGYIRTDAFTRARHDGTNMVVETAALTPIPSLYATYGGTANAITLTTGEGRGALVAGMEFRFKPTATNTGATTINVDGIGAVAAKTAAGAALSGGEIRNGADVVVRYDGSEFIVMLWPGRLLSTTVITAAGSGTYTVPADCYRLRVHGCAAGGGGGSGDGTLATGGDAGVGSGANSGQEDIFDIAVKPGQVINYTIGALGAGSTTAGVNGATGGNTTVSDGTTTFTMNGGEGGVSINAKNSASSVKSATPVFSVNSTSGAFALIRSLGKRLGDPGTCTPSAAVTGTGTCMGGNGGSSSFGTGGLGATTNANDTSAAGSAASGNGAGGGGGVGLGLATVGNGGAGGNGAIQFDAFS